MFFNEEIMVKVVAPKKYADLGRRLAHGIAQKPSFKSAYWTSVEYQHNEQTDGNVQHAIFIGDNEENAITKTFWDILEEKREHSGGFYAINGNKAFIWANGEEDYSKVMAEEFKRMYKEKSLWLGFLIPHSLPGVLSWYIYKIIKRGKLLKMTQIAFAVEKFIEETFDAWIEENQHKG